MAAARRRYRRNGGGGIGALIMVLIVIAIVIKFFWWILGTLALVGLFFLVRTSMRGNRKRRDAVARYRAEIAARADQQHNWVMQGDDRGIYGPQGAELMHFIEAPPQAAPTTEPSVTRWRMGPFGTRFAS